MTDTPDSLHYRKELENSLLTMRAASNLFYAMAIQCNHHQFVEFNGLLSKYIGLCEQTLAKNVDFVQSPFRHFEYADHDINYINEKLDCIFEGLSFAPVGKIKKIIDAAADIKKIRRDLLKDDTVPVCLITVDVLEQAVQRLCDLLPECYKP